MEKLLRELERRFGRYAPPNVAAFLIAPKAAFLAWYFLGAGDGDAVGRVFGWIALVPQLVLRGEVWRIFTYTFLPPTVSPLLFLFYALFLWFTCAGLQARWGSVRLWVYVLTGWLLTIASCFVAILFDPRFHLAGGFIAVETTILFAFATYYPELQVRLFFILPVKVKWIAWVAAGAAALQVARGPWDELAAYAPRVAVIGACANYLLFCGPGLWAGLRHRQAATSRRRAFEEGIRRGHEERDRLTALDREGDERDEPER